MSSTTMPRSSTPSTLPGPAQRVERIGGEQLAGVIYAAVWLVFLAVPMLGVFASDAGLVGQVYVCAAVVVFAGIYCWLAWSWFTCAEEDRPGWAALASAVGSLGLIGLSTVPFISAWAVAFAPYLTALVVFVRRPSQGIPLGILIWALPAAVGALFTDLESSWVVLGPGIGTVFIIAIRITEFYEDRGRRYAEHLRIADDGAGLGSSAEGNGLRGLRERAAAEGADVVVGRAYPELEGTQPERPGTVLEVSLR